MVDILKGRNDIPIGFGGAAISGEGGGYGFGKISEAAAILLLEAAFDRGIKIFDTAPIYGFGTSEKRIGKAFKSIREKVFLISKSGVTWSSSKRVDMTNDPAVTQKMLEQTLRDLNSEYIDLYMIHWPSKEIDIRRPMEVLARAKSEGKIRHIGLCNTNVSDIDLAMEIEEIEMVQSELNLFSNIVADELFPYLKELGIGFMGWGTFDKGILTSRVDESRTFDSCDARSWAPWWKKDKTKKAKYKKVREIQSAFEEINLISLAIAHNLSYQEVDLTLVGPRNIEQLNSILDALGELPDIELIEHAKKLVESI